MIFSLFFETRFRSLCTRYVFNSLRKDWHLKRPNAGIFCCAHPIIGYCCWLWRSWCLSISKRSCSVYTEAEAQGQSDVSNFLQIEAKCFNGQHYMTTATLSKLERIEMNNLKERKRSYKLFEIRCDEDLSFNCYVNECITSLSFTFFFLNRAKRVLQKKDQGLITTHTGKKLKANQKFRTLPITIFDVSYIGSMRLWQHETIFWQQQQHRTDEWNPCIWPEGVKSRIHNRSKIYQQKDVMFSRLTRMRCYSY